jgi:ABC-type cobalt transport system substrate-binding protein
MEFHWASNAWSGRVWFDVFQQWEPLTEIIFDPHTGELQFTRPNYGQRYIGTVSGNQLAGTFSYEGRSLPWEATRESTRRGPAVDLRRIQGLWFLNAGNVTGKMEFYWAGNAWSGRVWFDVFQQWEPLTEIIFDPHTGELQFTRPNYGQRYIGTLSGDQLVGTFVYQGNTLSWDARRH